MPNGWLLSAYRADSHAYWADWLVSSLTEWQWHRRELPGRHFAWRIRGNPLSWFKRLPEHLPELIVATSMVDLATIKGLNPRLAAVPCLYYFHENQFAYPRSDRQHSSVDAQMVQLYGAMAADRLGFNSQFNRSSFLDGIASLIERLPDQRPDLEHLLGQLSAKSVILPVPILPTRQSQPRQPGLICWPHRWEYDKQPDVFADAMLALAERGLDFRLALLGQRGPEGHPALTRLRKTLAGRIEVDGFVDRQGYLAWLNRSDLVVSTAGHEFQGLAMLEAVAAGACPVAPDALCYPEQYPAECRYSPGDSAALVDQLARRLTEAPSRPRIDLSAWSGPTLTSAWSTELKRTLQSRDGLSSTSST